jgi:hypothetical protein
MQKPACFSTLLLVLLISCTACALGQKEFGVLEGQVSIGPLVPAVQAGEPDPTPAPEVYAARNIVVFKKTGVTEYMLLEIDSTGRYHAELPAGIYTIDINHLGIDRADNLPLEITIIPDQITVLDINIDTGIR